MTDSKTHFVFVYGTLCNMHKGSLFNKNKVKLIGRGKTIEQFVLYDGGYPLCVPSADSTEKAGHVIGQLYEVDDDTLRGLDRYEGYPSYYDRYPTHITTDDGLEHEAELYVGNGAKSSIPHRAVVVPNDKEEVQWRTF